MKKLYIRFFNNRGNEVPVDAQQLICDVDDDQSILQMANQYSSDSFKWMMNHPEGKVDLVWL